MSEPCSKVGNVCVTCDELWPCRESLRLALAASQAKVARLRSVGQRLYGQAMTFAIQFHQREGHAGLFDDDTCGVGACRSTLRQMHDWEGTGDE